MENSQQRSLREFFFFEGLSSVDSVAKSSYQTRPCAVFVVRTAAAATRDVFVQRFETRGCDGYEVRMFYCKRQPKRAVLAKERVC